MPVPAAIPALAVLAGTIVGTLGHGLPAVCAAVLLIVAWLTALAALLARRHATLAVAVGLVFLVSAWTLAAEGEQAAADPPLRAALAGALRSGPVVIEGRLRQDAVSGDNGVGLNLDVDRAFPGSAAVPVRGGVRVTVTGGLGRERATEWLAGRRIRAPALLREPGRYRDPGVADGRLALARKGVALVGSVKSGALVEVRARGGWLSEAAAMSRRVAREEIERHVGCFSPRSAAIVTAILIGDRVGLDDEVQRRLQEAGTYHVIAISGGNIAILAGLILWLLRLARLGHRLGGWLAILALSAYAVVVGGGASVTRATLMAVIYLLARQADHRSAPLNTLAVACAAILLVVPQAVSDVGFWLTFGATLGILVGVAMAESSMPRVPWLRVPLALLVMSVSAELALFPMTAYVFARVTFAGLLLNFLAIPMMSVAQIAGMLVLVLSAAGGGAARVAGYVAHLGADVLVRSATLVDVVPWLTYRLPPPHWLPVAGYYAGWAAWLAARRPSASAGCRLRGRTAVRSAALGTILVCGLWVLIEPVTLVVPGVSGRLRVTVLDVGHGDAVLVQLADRRSVLVDAGGSMGVSSFDIGGRVVAPAVWALGTRRLDVLVLTHGDPDHIGGAASLVRDFRPREIWDGVPVPRLDALQALRRQAAAAGIPWHTRLAGDAARFGDVMVRVWHPPRPDWERQVVRNDDSLVIELRYRGVSIVLPGDIGRPVEHTLAAEIPQNGLRVVKVPHHGSATSSSWEFVSTLRPALAILSAGSTTKVSEDVLRRYRDVGAELFRTDVDGAITLDTDGRAVTLTTFSGRRARIAGGAGHRGADGSK